MKTTLNRAALVLLPAALLLGCPQEPNKCITGDEPECPEPTLPPDVCNSCDEAKADGQCALTLAAAKEGYLTTLDGGEADTDWYAVQLPAMDARSLLHVRAGYTVPQTAVNFSLNVLKDDCSTSVATAVDRHGAAAPKPVEIIMPYADGNTKLLLLVGDEGGSIVKRVDNRNPYTVMVEVVQNPDANEPNDATATALLDQGGGVLQGTGYLATTDDVDRYSFQVTGAARQIVYLHITGPNQQFNPPIPYRLSYTLLDPMMQPISEGVMDNEFLTVDLATARLSTGAGTYTVVVQGFKTGTTPVKGDLRLQHTVEVRILPDVDATEPNDTLATARALSMSPGNTQVLTGKLSYVPDEEWFALTLAASSAPTVLRYEVRVAGAGGRFPPLTTVPNRQTRLLTQVTTGATATARRDACKNNSTVCPKGYEGDSVKQLLVESMCDVTDPPQCLHAERNEEVQLAGLRNLENLVGAVPVPPHGAAVTYYFMFRDVGRRAQKYADDRDWTATLSYEADPDDAARLSGPVVQTLSGSPQQATGNLSHGYGRIVDPFDINDGDGVRGPNDYDAVPTDEDLFQFNYPAGATGDQAWSLEWDVGSVDGGSPAGDIGLGVTFCTGTGPCTGQSRLIANTGEATAPWYLPQNFGNATMLFSSQRVGNAQRVTLLPVACACFSAAQVASGRFLVNVVGLNRTGNAPIPYTLRQSVTAYPQSYTADGGASVACPTATGPDGGVPGCGFAR